jgi:hypothetical protein
MNTKISIHCDHRKFVVVMLSILLTVPPATAVGRQLIGTDSLKEQARANGGKISAQLHVDLPLGSLEIVTRTAEVIVHGTIHKVESRLTKDERDVLRYCTVMPRRILKDALKIAVTDRPRMTEPMVFVLHGGTVHVEGLEISSYSNVDLDPPLRAGEEVIAFLAKSPEREAFLLPYGPYGILRVREGRVVAGNKDVARWRPLASTGLADVLLELQALINASSR